MYSTPRKTLQRISTHRAERSRFDEEPTLEITIAAVAGVIAGVVAGIIISLTLLSKRSRQAVDAAAQQANAQLAIDRVAAEKAAKQQADEHLAQERADDQAVLDREQARLQQLESRIDQREEAIRNQEQQAQQRDDRLQQREQRLEQRQEAQTQALQEREEALANDQQRVHDEQQQLASLTAQATAQLESIAGMSAAEARTELLQKLEAELDDEQSRLIATKRKEAEEQAKKQGTEIVARAIQRYAAEHTAETTTSKVVLADEELKGRIIGKEGRNIRAFTQVSGVDVIIDDTPKVIILSCFDGVRREIARLALLDLMEDGRIHPARIEETFARISQEMDRTLVQLGEDAAFNCEVSGLHPQIIKLLGKLQYRTSYGQNVLQHTQEVAFLCGAMAADLGLDPKLGRRCGLLHDIGKAIDHEQEGSHPVLGYEALKRYNENEIVANAALAHHEGHEVLSVYTTLAAAADAISAARPGARRENSERYIKRLEQLEDIACSFKGVRQAYAIQAGRELRVIIDGHTLRDESLPKVARDIARTIEDQVAYPGEVRVTLIRETRQSALAR